MSVLRHATISMTTSLCSMQPNKISAHNVFAGERLRDAGVPGLNTQLIKDIPSMWKALSDEEKEVCSITNIYSIHK